jgi:hypothetical protein
MSCGFKSNLRYIFPCQMIELRFLPQMRWKVLQMTNCVAEFGLGFVRQTVEPLLNRLILVEPLKSKKLPIPFRVGHIITKLRYINKNLDIPLAITSILMYTL